MRCVPLDLPRGCLPTGAGGHELVRSTGRLLAARALGVARSFLLGSDGLHPVPLDARSRRVAPVPECRAHLWVGRFLVP